MMSTKRNYWQDLENHFLHVLDDPWYKDLILLQDSLSKATAEFFDSKGMRTMHLPLTTHSISSPMGLGSDSKPVQIDLFGQETYLADSMQFMLEYGCRLHPQGCYYLMPAFRGESADETHLCQFYHAEAEIPGGLEDVMHLVEDYVRFLSMRLLEQRGDIIHRSAGTFSHIEKVIGLTDGFPRVTMEEAVDILGASSEYVTQHERGFYIITRQGEHALIERYGGIVWLTEPDQLAVPFYQALCDNDESRAKAADLLFGVGETVGCGERHCEAKDVLLALNRHEVESAPYRWYMEIREKIPMQTSGFGLGTERFLSWMLQHHDVRDFQILPRLNGVAVIP